VLSIESESAVQNLSAAAGDTSQKRPTKNQNQTQTMSTKPTNSQIANNYILWAEYVDPSGLTSEAEFDAMTEAEKMEFIEKCFGPEDKTPATVAEILAAKAEAGPDAYLWLQADAGDCILWPSEEAAQNDDGSNAIQRWTITADEADNEELLAQVDDLN
jgi:hypothetical protein